MGVQSAKDPDTVGMAFDTEPDYKALGFPYPVDSEHKSKIIKLYSIRGPHHKAFHLSWLAFFSAFVSTFAPAAVLPLVRDSCNLTKTDLGNAGIAAVCGAILMRVLMGNFVDTFGPRLGISSVVAMTAPAVFCVSMVTNATGFIVVRFFIGFSLATFVACQFWCTSMFNPRIVGTANAFAAGWGNMGGGFTHLIMPVIATGFANVAPIDQAWRWAFFVPGGLQIVTCILVMLFSQDLPDGNYVELRKRGTIAKKPGGWHIWKAALTNYRTWVMTLTYGYSFGVELTVDNVISQYLYDQFNLTLTTAGYMGSLFGLMNIFTRGLGGVLSDVAAKYAGMRGRLWALWICQTLNGVFCLAMGLSSASLGGTIGLLVIFSIFCQMSCGLSFGVVPFVSKRATGLVSGFTGAGGNTGGAVTQAIFFTYATYSVDKGFVWMGVMTIGVTALYMLVYFPMWGGMFFGPRKGVSEEDYYLSEYTAEERAQGLHSASLKFAYESRSQRGRRNPLNDADAGAMIQAPAAAKVAV